MGHGVNIQKYRSTTTSTNNTQLAPDPNFAFPRGACEGLIRPRTDFIPPVREYKLRTRGAPFRVAFSWSVGFEDAEDHGGSRTCVPLLDQADGGALALVDLAFVPAALLETVTQHNGKVNIPVLQLLQHFFECPPTTCTLRPYTDGVGKLPRDPAPVVLYPAL